jgi:hypothetical protein
MDSLSCPLAMMFGSLNDAIRYNYYGYSSATVVYYINRDIDHVTPAAYADYIEGNNWTNLYNNVKDLINTIGVDETIIRIHRERFN